MKGSKLEDGSAEGDDRFIPERDKGLLLGLSQSEVEVKFDTVCGPPG